ncbi:MAG: hypothetical protein JRI75_07715 [Deltaproteobacteria bacterium]|nr:hypothetical protein [Deltaproteobacteria bacterium]
MRKLLVVTMIIAVFMVFGCAKYDPQNVAEDFVKEQFQSDQPIKVNTSRLKYKIVEKTDSRATIEVYGTIDVAGQIMLVKEGKKWKITENEPVPVEAGIVH